MACATRPSSNCLYSTGMRVSELVGLRVSDMEMRMGCLRCIGKGDKERMMPVGRKALAAVQQYLETARPELLARRRPGKPPPQNLFINRSGNRISRIGIWRILTQLRPRGGHPDAAFAAQAAPQLRHAFAGARRRSAVGAINAGARRHFDNTNLHARHRGAPETDLQGAPPARVRMK